MISGLFIALGGFLGAICRYVLQRMIKIAAFPAATLLINLTGAFLLGSLVGKGLEGRIYLVTGIGFLGAFTTFSTLNVDLLKLFRKKQFKSVLWYAGLTYFGGIGLGLLGLWAGNL